MAFNEYPLEKYRFFTHTNKDGIKEVIAVSTFAGKYVSGTAKCNPKDEYDYEIGKKIAATKCALKIANRRKARATDLYEQALVNKLKATRYLEQMEKYVNDADEAINFYTNKINELIKG